MSTGSAAGDFSGSQPTALALLTHEQQEQLSIILDDYLSALEQGQADREKLLADHPELSAALEVYLAKLDALHSISVGFHSDTSLASATASPAVESVVDIDDSSVTSPIAGCRLGDFELVKQIGRGGMGLVFEAKQISLQRRVAVKVLPFASLLDATQIARFKHEAQAAAQLQHPHIVPVYAIGYEKGVHFYAMQLIDGVPLDAAIEQAKQGQSPFPQLSAEDIRSDKYVQFILNGFAQVAEALNAAHDTGIVHRDMKPSNILIDTQGKFWVTDFGLARFQQDQTLTRTGDLVGTMRYMSPEQATGVSAMVDHRTDIYSLAATLYEALTLRPVIEGDDSVALLRSIGTQTPPPLQQLVPHASKDLSVVIDRALAPARDDRYLTAQEFANDLRHVQRGEPTKAQPPDLWQRWSRWTLKHRTALSVAAMVSSLIGGGLAVSTILIAREKQRTELNFERAESYFRQAHEAVEKLGTGVAEQLANVPGSESVRKDVLQRSLLYYEEFARSAANVPTLQSDLAVTHSRIGSITDRLGDSEKAIASFTEANRIFQKLAEVEPERSEYRRQWAKNLNNEALILARKNELSLAQAAYEKALQLQADLYRDTPASLPLALEYALTQNNFGLLSAQRAQWTEALRHYDSALVLLSTAAALAPDDPLVLKQTAATQNNRSAVITQTDPQQAVTLYRESLAMQLKAATQQTERSQTSQGKSDGSLNAREELPMTREIALTYTNLASAEAKCGHWSEALNAHQSAIKVLTRLVDLSPQVVTYQHELAIAWNNQGMTEQASGHPQDALVSFREAVRLQERLVDKFPRDQSMRSALASILNNLASSLESLQQTTDSIETYRQAIEQQTIAYQESGNNLIFRDFLQRHWFNYGRLLRNAKQPRQAAEAALARREFVGDSPEKIWEIAEELANCSLQLLANGDLANAKEVAAHCQDAVIQARRAGLNNVNSRLETPPFSELLKTVLQTDRWR